MFTINLEDGREAPSKPRKKGAKRLEFLVCVYFLKYLNTQFCLDLTIHFCCSSGYKDFKVFMYVWKRFVLAKAVQVQFVLYRTISCYDKDNNLKKNRLKLVKC